MQISVKFYESHGFLTCISGKHTCTILKSSKTWAGWGGTENTLQSKTRGQSA